MGLAVDAEMGRVGIFGKIRSHGDFVALGTGSATGRAFERWTQLAYERIVLDAGRFSSDSRSAASIPSLVGFLYRDVSSHSALIGVLRDSVDSVGRRFPLAVFWEVTEPGAFEAIAGFPRPLTPLLGAMLDVLHEPYGSADLLRAAVARLEPPSDFGASCADMVRELRGLSLSSLLEQLEPRISIVYVSTLLRRAGAHAVRFGPKQPIYLDLPVSSDAEMTFWLACAAAVLPRSLAFPAAYWDVDAGRLVLVFGAPQSETLGFLRTPPPSHTRLWTAASDRQRSHGSLEEAVGPALARVLEQSEHVEVGAYLDALPVRDDEDRRA